MIERGLGPGFLPHLLLAFDSLEEIRSQLEAVTQIVAELIESLTRNFASEEITLMTQMLQREIGAIGDLLPPPAPLTKEVATGATTLEREIEALTNLDLDSLDSIDLSNLGTRGETNELTRTAEGSPEEKPGIVAAAPEDLSLDDLVNLDLTALDEPPRSENHDRIGSFSNQELARWVRATLDQQGYLSMAEHKEQYESLGGKNFSADMAALGLVYQGQPSMHWVEQQA